jgi:hypothetical protein
MAIGHDEAMKAAMVAFGRGQVTNTSWSDACRAYLAAMKPEIEANAIASAEERITDGVAKTIMELYNGDLAKARQKALRDAQLAILDERQGNDPTVWNDAITQCAAIIYIMIDAKEPTP